MNSGFISPLLILGTLFHSLDHLSSAIGAGCEMSQGDGALAVAKSSCPGQSLDLGVAQVSDHWRWGRHSLEHPPNDLV